MSKDLRNVNIRKYIISKGYKGIFKDLNIADLTMCNVIKKFQKHETAKNLIWAGEKWMTEVFDWCKLWIKHPQKSKDLKVHLE